MIVARVVEILKEEPVINTALVGGVWPIQWPDAPTFPLAIVQKATTMGEADMNGGAGIESARVQIDVYGDRGYAQVAEIARDIKRRLHGSRVGPASAPCAINASFCINDADQPVPEAERAGPRLRRRMLEFRIWTTEV